MGIRSGRKIAMRFESDTAYMYLAEMYQPDFRTINDFMKDIAYFLSSFLAFPFIACHYILLCLKLTKE